LAGSSGSEDDRNGRRGRFGLKKPGERIIYRGKIGNVGAPAANLTHGPVFDTELNSIGAYGEKLTFAASVIEIPCTGGFSAESKVMM
jgi:hypothetical protein